jgi:membrane protease YdiL (CAAX protease family)
VQALRPLAGPVHTLGLLAFLAVHAYLSYTQAGQMRAAAVHNHLPMYLQTMAIEWLTFGYVVYGARSHGVSLKELLGPRWSSGKQTLIDFGIAASFLVGSLFIIGIVGYLLRMRSGLENVKFMFADTPLELVGWVLLSITAGICEETIFRAYLQRQFAAWTRSLPVGIVLSAAVFGAAHIYQSGKQAISVGVLGLLLGILAAVRRSTKPGMIAHSAQDAFAGILGSIAKWHHFFGM